MKNVHLLPTDKSSRLYLHSENELQLRTNIIRTSEDYLGSNQHIYITNSEEIKEGINQWYLDKFINKPRNSSGSQYREKQDVIILTTDQDLIKDGIQAIDDEFLEWFVKNPSCEWVEVEKGYLGMGGFCKSNEIISKDKIHYKIIIPKEEPKHETVEEDLLDTAIQIVGSNNVITIREFLIKHKWQQDKKLYSEEEVIAMLKSHKLYIISELRGLSKFKNEKEWFKQFKKK